MSKHFTHLHLHTDHSLLDGAISLDKLVAFGKEQNLKALAITDHGNIFGAVKFFEKCKKAGIKPIVGIEAYLTEDASIKNAQNKYYHQILLVQNEQGYKNLCKLISFSFQKGFYFKPRIDYNVLEQYSEGLIATSACLGGHVANLLREGNQAALDTQLDWFLRVFGEDRYYLEIQPEDQQEQKIFNQQLYDLAQRRGIPLVATGDCHYPSLADHEAHEVMLAIQTHDKMDNHDRYTFGDCRVYMRTADEMLAQFPGHDEAVWNTGVIADSCNFDFQTGKLFFPQFEIPKEHTPITHFKYLSELGFEKLLNDDRIPRDQETFYRERLDLEIQLISTMGFVEYFLVVSDFIQWARRNGIPVGPGRGSAAGSLVSWALEITDIDPIKYNLLFERFLNPERVTMPDIDIDFCIDGREAVINYVRDKYGHDKVCQIITFGTMMAKGVIKDVARALGVPFEDSNMITNLIPDQLKITLKESLELEPRLQELIDSNPKVHKVFDLAFRLEGLTRHASKHAAGIVISPHPIDEVLPVYVPPRSTELVTQYAMTELESLGFLKIDLLGLKNLTLIDKAVKMIHKYRGIQLNMPKLALDDTKTFELISAGKTSGVFQLESSGLQEVLCKLQPTTFEDIIAVNALYRPGPLGSGMVDDFIERKHGRQKITYLFEELEPILKETYGVIVYQEQVMKIASTIAGYSLGESDILRRAMGKKKAEVMAEQKELFLKRAVERNFNAKRAGDLFDLMAYFAGYGFNKSHSAAYALLAYQTAYLKANFAPEFMACLITLEAQHAEKMSFYLQEAKDMGITILPPDINRSEIDFTVENQSLLFGLQGIKNVGLAALENIITERAKKPFKDILDLCQRIDLRTANKRVIENLICAGALDTLPGRRSQKHAEVQKIIDFAVDYKKTKATGQMGLFSKPHTQDSDTVYEFQPLKEWDDREKLEKEKEVIGFYLSSHPLETYREQLNWLSIPSFAQSLAAANAHNSMQEPIVLACGLLKSRRDITTKKGDRMAFIQLEDMESHAEIVLFPKTFKRVEQWLDNYHVFVIKGAVDITSQQKCKIKADDCVPIELLLQEWPNISKLSLVMPPRITDAMMQKMKELLGKGKIPLELVFHENGQKLRLTTKEKVAVDGDIITHLEAESIAVRLTI